jgi:dihydrofolate synthase/folylpolyglutamate synthase
VFQLGREFGHRIEAEQWHWHGLAGMHWGALPPPALRGRVQYDNASTSLCAAALLKDRLPVSTSAVRQALLRTRLPGRFSLFPGKVTWILDVAHNAEAARTLAANLAAFPCAGRCHAVFSLLADKDAVAVSGALATHVHHWHIAPAQGQRAMPVDALQAAIAAASDRPVARYADVEQAITGAASAAEPGDCVLVFGSFVTVEVALRNRTMASV